MSIIEEIKSKLKKYPDLEAEEGENSIAITPANGFTVWATENGNSYTIGFEGWHEEFDESEDALNCFAWGLSNSCRLKVFTRGNTPYKWIVQSLEKGQWVNGSTTGLIFFPFWCRAQIAYKQNAVINS